MNNVYNIKAPVGRNNLSFVGANEWNDNDFVTKPVSIELAHKP